MLPLIRLVKKYYFPLLVGAFSTEFVCELLVTEHQVWGKIGMIFWYLLLLLLFVYAGYQLVIFLKISFKQKTFLTLIALLVFSIILVVGISDPRNISGETNIETNCMLNRITNSEDAGFASNCFIGYPGKQFYLSALPSLLFGRSLISLNLGGSLYLILGLIIFVSGVFTYFKKNYRRADLLGFLALAIPLHAYYFNYLFYNFEQSFFPVSFGFMICGLYLAYLRTKSKRVLMLIGFILLILVASYTTSLALYALSLLVLVYEFLKTRDVKTRLLILSITLVSLLSLLLVMQYREDIRLITGTRDISFLKKDLNEALYLFITNSSNPAWFTPILHPLVLLLLGLSLLFFLRIKGFVVGIWAILVMAMSVVAQGYTYQPVSYMFHRATVVIPVVLTLVILALNLQKIFAGKRYLVAIVLGFFLLITGVINIFKFLESRTPEKYSDFYHMITWLKDNLPEESNTKGKAIYFANSLDNRFLNINDVAQYFLPDYSIIYSKDLCLLTFDTSTSNNYLVINKELRDDTCLAAKNLLQKGNYRGRDGIDFQLYEFVLKY